MKLNRTKTFLLASITALTVVGMTVSATAQDKGGGGSGWLTQGAEILPMGKKAFEFRFGFPSTDFGIRIPVLPIMEVTPFFTMDYVAYGPAWTGYFGDSFGAQLKFKLWGAGPMAVSLGFDLGLATNYIGKFNLAFQIGGPEVKFSYRWNNPNIAVIGGFKMPIRVWLLSDVAPRIPATSANIPLLFTLGTEYHVLSNLNIHAHIEVGPEICASSIATAVGGRFGFQFGISYLF